MIKTTNKEELTEESRISILKASIQEGIDSGIATSFDSESHLAELKARKRSRG